jgi:peptide/nickel transport system substrate-binding protein
MGLARLFGLSLAIFLISLAGTAGADSLSGRGGVSSAAQAGVLRIGTAVPVTADPHRRSSRANRVLNGHVHQSLVRTDANDLVHPGLASSWQMLPDGAWRFVLRDDVRMQTGRRLEARDVLFSLCRTRAVSTGKGSPGEKLVPLVGIEVGNGNSLILRFDRPYRNFPLDVAQIAIIAAPDGWQHSYDPAGCQGMPGYTTAQFDNAELAVGAGPYRLSSFSPDRLELIADPINMPAGPTWARVEMIDIPIPDLARALVRGQLDVAEGLPFQAIEHMRSSPQLQTAMRVISRRSSTLYYMQINHRSGPPALRDRRVRQAIDLAIDRRAIAQRVLSGHGTPTVQIALPGSAGHDLTRRVMESNADAARALLAEAGIAEGTRFTLLVPDIQLRSAEAVGQFLERAGLRIAVESLPSADFYRRLHDGAFELAYAGVQLNTTNLVESMRSLMGTSGGNLNYGRYSNPELDALLMTADAAEDSQSRLQALQAAEQVARDDVAYIPLLFGHARWGMRADLAFMPRLDRVTLAMDVTVLPADLAQGTAQPVLQDAAFVP